MNLSKLDKLAIKYQTDKAPGCHGFTRIYNNIFSKYEDEKFNMLEIGVYFGSSIRMWKDYFKNAIIYGGDTFKGIQGNGSKFRNPKKYYNELLNNPQDRINLKILDQSSELDLKNFVDKCKEENIKFKIILDDGSHLMRDQQITFFYLFELLEDDGIYVIEDIHTSEQDGYDVLPDESNSTKKIFMNMKKKGEVFKSIYIDDKETSENISNSIRDIKLYEISKDSQTLFIFK